MANVRAGIDRGDITTTLHENPELAAMAAICDILRDLSEDERLRVMRWAFGRFSNEFKRPVPEITAIPEPAGDSVAPARPVDATAAAAGAAAPDFERQISELSDLFPSRVPPQRRAGDPRKILEFV